MSCPFVDVPFATAWKAQSDAGRLGCQTRMSTNRINKRFVGETPAANRADGWHFSTFELLHFHYFWEMLFFILSIPIWPEGPTCLNWNELRSSVAQEGLLLFACWRWEANRRAFCICSACNRSCTKRGCHLRHG